MTERDRFSEKLEWLQNAAQEAFAALDHGAGIPLPSIDSVDRLVNEALENVRDARSLDHFTS